MDVERLSAARRDVERGSPARLSLNLFADAEFEAVMERTAPTASGYTLTGRLAGDPLSMVVVAVNGVHMAGTVWSSRSFHSIRARDGVAVVRQLDPAAGERCGVGEASPDKAPLSPSHGPNSTTSKPLSAVPSQTINSPFPPKAAAALSVMPRTDNGHPPDDGSVIDVLFVYPARVRRFEGGHRAMRALIDRDVAMVNEAYRTSGAEQRIALVAAVETDLPLSVAVDIQDSTGYKLKSKSDGHMDEVHALRDSYAADFVHLHLGSELGLMPTREGAGLLSRANVSDADAVAFSVSRSINLAHELGHNMGLHHDRGEAYPPDAPAVLQGLLHPYSYGYLAPKPNDDYPWATIMAYYGYRLPRFSNPRQRYPDESGVPLGVPGEEWTTSVDGPADAVRSLNNTRRLVANHRASASRCAYALSPAPPTVPAAGGEYRIRVGTAPGCVWSARADGDGFAEVTSGTGGNGLGEVAFRVLANKGLEREPAILVAGEVYSFPQAGAREVKSVCEREPPIRRAILKKVGKRCEDVTADDLADISSFGWEDVDGDLPVLSPGTFDGLRNLRGFLHLEGKGIGTVAPGAFDGLDKLRYLYLNDNNLSEVAPGAFRGMPSLRHLALSGNRLALQPGMFSGLSELEVLSLNESRIAKLGPNSFEGLSNLEGLFLEDNELETLAPGAFEGLSRLRQLRLNNNELETLAPGAFGGLSKLRYLALEGNGLEALAPGVFQGLEKLERLRLSNNRLARLKPGMFVGLAGLRHLVLDRNGIAALEPDVFADLSLFGLYLDDNRLTELKPGVFAHLSSLRNLFLEGNALSELDPSLFGSNPPGFMKRLHLGGNNLRSLQPGLTTLLREIERPGRISLTSLRLDTNQLESLPTGLFEGLALLLKLDLRRNPGAPFALMANLVALPAAGAGSGRPNAVAAEVAEGAPFDMTVKLSVAGAVLSASEVLIPKGATRSASVSVTRAGAAPVTIRLGLVHDAEIDQCDEGQWRTFRVFCYGGIRPVAGPPLVLYGLPDQALPPDSTVNLHLRSAFPDFPEGTTFTAELSDPVAEAVVEGGTLTVSWAGGGAATVTVAAIGPDGRRGTRRFEVRALAPPEAVGGISNLSVVAGESTRVAVSDKFRDPDGGLLTYAAESSDPAVASVSVDEGAVRVAGQEPGAATVTLTATDPDGLSATLTFRVAVVRDINSYWSGWRSVLLKSPSSADGDGS